MTELHCTSAPVMRLALRCELSAVATAARSVREFLVEQGCSKEEVVACEVALVEACNNAIQYARPEEQRSGVRVEARCGAEDIELRILDRTGGFDWPQCAALPETASERGRGLFLIRQMTDSAEYVRGKPTNELVLRKKRVRS